MQVRVPDDLIDRIDKLRDPLIPREAYIRSILAEKVEDIERRSAKSTRKRKT